MTIKEVAGEGELSRDSGPVSSGLPALDYILSGGFAANRIHLIEGEPGAGKTTLGLQFLREGIARGSAASTSRLQKAVMSSCTRLKRTAGITSTA